MAKKKKSSIRRKIGKIIGKKGKTNKTLRKLSNMWKP